MVNCIIWNEKSAFLKDSYISLIGNLESGIATATGMSIPVGIGMLEIGWYDDAREFHNFLIPNMHHVPELPVNILGLSTFFKFLQDYQKGGTRINSSGKDSIFTRDNGKFSRTFLHSESHMLELPVNDGYSKFHKLCNFLDRYQPIHQQCYHVHSKQVDKYKQIILYAVGEEVLHKNKDHIIKGIVEDVTFDQVKKCPMVNIKFSCNRNVKAYFDQIMLKGETDVATIPLHQQNI